MLRAIAALLGAALAFPALMLALGLDEALGGPLLVGGLIFGMVVALGFPALSLFCKLRWWDAWRFVLGGVVGGALCALPFLGDARFGAVYLVVIFALVGGALAVLFWIAAIWRNDALTCPKEFCLPCGVAYRFARNVLRRRSRG